ncbi:MAG: YdcF family protein [Polyangiaceae bacterium]|nr:YdcF family protein [Polyangiaceae bacterium]
MSRALFVGAMGLLASHRRVAQEHVRSFNHSSDISAGRVALVLGCTARLKDGRPNLYFRYRMEAAARLYFEGRVRLFLLSGDDDGRGYDEPTDMFNALIQAGVPEQSLMKDPAGFRTLDSLIRARRVFGVGSVVIVSQRFHNERALYIAQHFGYDAIAYNALTPDVSRWKNDAREVLARARVMLDLHVLDTQPRSLEPAS